MTRWKWLQTTSFLLPLGALAAGLVLVCPELGADALSWLRGSCRHGEHAVWQLLQCAAVTR